MRPRIIGRCVGIFPLSPDTSPDAYVDDTVVVQAAVVFK